jgi:uncharacterized protein YecE (DUF72 family)
MTMRLGPARFHLGTQGWNYPAWVGPVYPRAARSADFLPLYTRLFDTVEVDSTFYAVPSAPTIENWARRTPPTFRFALKFPREATHDAGLAGKESKETLVRFVERVRPLGPRLGPILIQLPAEFAPSRRSTLEGFLDALPPDLAFAVEFRDPAWLATNVMESLAARRIAPTLTDSPFLPLDAMLDLASGIGERAVAGLDFVYVRWLGNRDLTDYSRVQLDRSAELARWATVLPPLLARGIDVYGYFNNHYQGHSPASARAFMELVGITPKDPADLDPQGDLF